MKIGGFGNEESRTQVADPSEVSAGPELQGATDVNQMSIIGSDIVITGNIEASVDLQIEGKVVGDVRCATLILGQASFIKGRIFATRVKVSGSVEGSIDARDLALEAGGVVNGEIAYERLRVANGGAVEGTLIRKTGDEAAKLKLVKSRSADKSHIE